MELRVSRRRRAKIDLTSLIDVLFLLLIFFMVSTTFLSQPAINLELPKAEHADETRQTPVVVYIDRDGRIFLNDEPVERALLGEALRARVSTLTEKAVVLKADSSVPHGTVVGVYDIIKGVGITKLIVSTRPEDE